MEDTALNNEIERLKSNFSGADENKLAVLASMIEQAAIETLYLRRLNGQAVSSGLVRVHPKNPCVQKTLPVSVEIARHTAALTNIMNKLMKYLEPTDERDDNDLSDYE